MGILNVFKCIIPEFHAYSDEDKRYNIGATWTDSSGFRDFHNLEVRYVRNSERLAIENGTPMPDGSWQYTEPSGAVHTMSAERAKQFMEATHQHATILCTMLDKLRDSGADGETLDTTAQPA
jgi:hypothetical protein